MRTEAAFDWRTIGALNAVSALAQIGQFGIAFVMLPVWLAQQGLGATQLGMFAASLWLGQLPGLALGPWLCRRFGPRRVVVAGLLSTLIALVWIAALGWPWAVLGGTLAGFGLGVRWIGVEPWLYRIAPDHARGRLVGFHETLIAIAPVVAPGLAGAYGLEGRAVFWIGAVFLLAASVPLAFARGSGNPDSLQPPGLPGLKPVAALRDRIFKQGVAIALVGGMMEAAVSGLFALFAQDRGISVGQTADLLVVFGVGGLLLQYAVGWLADHRGLGTAAVSCAVGTALAAASLAMPLTYLQTGVGVFLLGGFITSFLTLALIASTKTSSGDIVSNVSMVSMLYTVSAIVGPLVAGASMNASHGDALMWFTSTASLALVGVLVWLAVPRPQAAL